MKSLLVEISKNPEPFIIFGVLVNIIENIIKFKKD